MLGFFGFVFIVAGALALAGSSTIVGQIGGLILWVIAALFLVGGAVISAIEREARGIGAALAMQAQASRPATSLERPAPAAPPKTLWRKFCDWWWAS